MAVHFFTVLFLLELALNSVVLSQNICPDHTVCSRGATCCQMTDGNYGCCPLIDAVCCSDKEHCCPANTQCDLILMRCTSENSLGILDNSKAIALFPVLPSASVNPQSTGLKCGNKAGFSCPLNTTCCSSPFGHDGCCPTPKGECCSDFLHCCPENFACDVNIKSCVKDNIIIPWFRKMSLFPFEREVKENAPDSKKYLTKLKYLLQKQITDSRQLNVCNGNETICSMDNSNYGCCPFSEAVCCSDKLHCCPTHSECDIGEGTCRSGMASDNFLVIEESPLYPLKRTLIAKIKYESELNKASDVNVMCEDKTVCGDNDTCCSVGKHQFGCCPYVEGVCCSDLLHCCPQGTRCDRKYGCISVTDSSMNFQDTSMHPEINEIKANVICPDKKHQCSGNKTCCLNPAGSFSCCPYPNAVCCNDKQHCCPEGYTCATETGHCIAASTTHLLKELENDEIREVSEDSVICPDKHKCLDGTTCCILSSGSYGCCPYPDAVCCKDKLHCCPNGYACDLQRKSCVESPKTATISSVLEKSQLRANVICPDKKERCADNTTCCKTKSGQYGCCRFPHAVCCSDEEHCCPAGYTCDTQHSRCVKTSGTTQLQKLEENYIEDNVICPDKKSRCADNTTCCKTKSGQYSCCRFPHAVCCSDEEHCCPEGYTCDIQHRRCVKTSENTSLQKLEEDQIKVLVDEVVCPGGNFTCPSDFTCCPLKTGGFGCCRWKEAVCCNDGLSCCPHNTVCHIETGQCLPKIHSIPWNEKTLANKIAAEDNMSIKGNKIGNSETRIGNHFYIFIQSIFGKTEAIKDSLDSRVEIVCPGGAYRCPTDNTCCRMNSGRWGCCRAPFAVCCSDGRHCCPHGYRCTGGGRCTR